MQNSSISSPSFSALQVSSETRVAIVAARWNADIIDRLVAGAYEAWSKCGGDASRLELLRCPGSYELPFAAMECAQTGRYDAVIVLGCVIRGETYHFEIVAEAASNGIMRVMLETRVPCIFGVLTTNTVDQALARAATGMDNKGYEAVFAALEMIALQKHIRTVS